MEQVAEMEWPYRERRERPRQPRLHFLEDAREQFRALPQEVKLYVEQHFENVALLARPSTLLALEQAMRTRGHLFEFTVGSYRTVYAVHPTTRAITVYRIEGPPEAGQHA